MKLNPSETSLVITGAWNPAILTPQWMFQHALGGVGDNEQIVQVMMPAGLNGAFEYPRFSLPQFTYIARPEALVIIPNATNSDHLNAADVACHRLLGHLHHTPVGGLGHNFEFIYEDPDAKFLGIFSTAQQDLVDATQGWEVVRSTVATSFKVDNVNVNIQRYLEGDRLVMKFNFHHQIASAATALQILEGTGFKNFTANFELAVDLVKKLYGDVET